MTTFRELSIVFIVAAIISVVGLAIYKIIKSKLPDNQKILLTILVVAFNILAAIPFIIFHDYFLSKEKRAA